MKYMYFVLIFLNLKPGFEQDKDRTERLSEFHRHAIRFKLPGKIESIKQTKASLQVIRVPTRVYSRFPAPTDPDEKHQLLIIKIVSVSLVLLLILYLLLRRRNRKTFID
jgi:hypothetical protein